jgi:ABC-2 type transport system ATP-binding protein
MDYVIKVQDLTKKFGELVAVDTLNFAVEQGEVFGLLGPNGAGKTTTLSMLCTILKPSGA